MRSDGDNDNGYSATADRMFELASEQPGFLGVESARETLGITVSYWVDLQSIKNWKANVEHEAVQKRGRNEWYSEYRVRVCKVERDYGV